VTNLRFLRWLVRQPVVLDGEARTDTLDRIWPPDDWADRAAIPEDAWRTAAVALAGIDPADPWSDGWRLNAGATLRLETGSDARPVTIEPPQERFERVVAAGTVHVDLGGRSAAFRLAPPPDVDRAARAAAGHVGGGSVDVLAPMPGAVLTVHVAIGAVVVAGDPIVTLEAMKMEHVVAAPFDGRVTELAVRPADQVTRGQALAAIES
jgi:3-methylcrotonyl-CoA carboxylase alpha subunit